MSKVDHVHLLTVMCKLRKYSRYITCIYSWSRATKINELTYRVRNKWLVALEEVPWYLNTLASRLLTCRPLCHLDTCLRAHQDPNSIFWLCRMCIGVAAWLWQPVKTGVQACPDPLLTSYDYSTECVILHYSWTSGISQHVESYVWSVTHS